jgi:cellulose 1,4-beta-cellobiosidase
MQVSGLNVDTSWNISVISSGVWDAAYDVWFHRTSDYTGDQPNGAELMIWISYTAHNWAQKKVGTVSLAGTSWDVYYWVMTSGSGSWNYIAYLRNSNATYASFNLNTFVKDAVSRGYIQNSWYLVAVDAGFELWQGGAGLASNSFSVTAVQAKVEGPVIFVWWPLITIAAVVIVIAIAAVYVLTRKKQT